MTEVIRVVATVLAELFGWLLKSGVLAEVFRDKVVDAKGSTALRNRLASRVRKHRMPDNDVLRPGG